MRVAPSSSRAWLGVCVALGITVLYVGCANAGGDDTADASIEAGADVAVVCEGGPTSTGCACDPKKPLSVPDCYEGPKGTANKGVCKYGKHTCANGVVSDCIGQILPSDEICNGLDDDCNGMSDDVPVDAGSIGTFEDARVTCTTMLAGICKYGQIGCVKEAGAGCVPFVTPMSRMEDCNGLDDDCNAIVDDGIGNGMCNIANLKGECAKGSEYCTTGPDGGGGEAGLNCKQVNFVKAETCNAKDDDCNGVVDNGTNLQLCQNQFKVCVNGVCEFICPYVFSYDGTKFAYETSVGGASLIGKKQHLTEGREQSFKPMWARLDHAAKDGVVRTKLIAAEDEIVYFDAARVTTIEHDPGFEVLTSSSIQWDNEPDPQEFYALRSAAMRTPVAASWMGMADVTTDLGRVDDRAASYDVHSANSYDVDFGAVRDVSHARIVIDGWKFKLPRDLAKGVPIERPHLDVKQRDGSWRKALDLGTPRGDKKTIAFDLSKVAFPTGRYEVRLVTGTHEDGNAMWYVDRVRLTEEAAGSIVRREVPLSSAQLSFMRPPTRLNENAHDEPIKAIDDGGGELLAAQRTWGHFTRYGDVRELLGASDDRMIVMRRGDGVEMRFDGIVRAAPGRETTVFMMTDLVFKPRKWLTDAHATTLTENVEPLPFHGMGRYPPSASFPNDTAHKSWLDQYQTRVYMKGDTRWGP